MKFLCTACDRLVELRRFRLEGAGLLVRCEQCGAESRAEGEPSPRPNVVPLRPDAAPSGFCPKCIAPRLASALSCPQCGLLYDQFAPEEVSPSEELALAWAALQPRWAEPEAHDGFLSLALGQGELASAGRLYRIRLVERPDDAQAQRAREEVVRLALLPSRLNAGAEPARPRRLWLVAAAVLLFVFCLAAVLFLLRMELPS